MCIINERLEENMVKQKHIITENLKVHKKKGKKFSW